MRPRYMLSLILVFSSLHCAEDLPSYVIPDEVLRPSITAPDGIFLVNSPDPSPGGTIDVSALNEYDEVVADTEQVQVTIDVWMENNPAYRERLIGSRRNLRDPTILSGRLVILKPQTAATIRMQMTHRTSDGTPFWTVVGTTRVIPPNGSPYYASGPVYFRALATIQVFKSRPIQQTNEIRFSVDYHIY
jgi:hypothetical protein